MLTEHKLGRWPKKPWRLSGGAATGTKTARRLWGSSAEVVGRRTGRRPPISMTIASRAAKERRVPRLRNDRHARHGIDQLCLAIVTPLVSVVIPTIVFATFVLPMFAFAPVAFITASVVDLAISVWMIVAVPVVPSISGTITVAAAGDDESRADEEQYCKPTQPHMCYPPFL